MVFIGLRPFLALQAKLALFFHSESNRPRGLDDVTGTSPAGSCHCSLCSATPMVCKHCARRVSYWASDPSLHGHPLMEIKRYRGAGILDVAPASSARVTPPRWPGQFSFLLTVPSSAQPYGQ